MNYVTELSKVLRDSNVSQDDKQAALKSLRDLADKGDPEARNALDTGLRIPLSPLQGSLDKRTFAAVLDSCCKDGLERTGIRVLDTMAGNSKECSWRVRY